MLEVFNNNYFALFFVISIGIILGHVKVKGVSLDLSAVIFVALLMGHLGVVIPDDFQKIGLVLFIFTIGIQSGPGFFDSFRKYGVQLSISTVILIVSGAIVSYVCALIFNIDFKIIVGIFAGALTSTPGLAAAIESSHSPLASIGYGIAYPFGVIGVILFIRMLPTLLKVNLSQAEKDYDQSSREEYPEIKSQNFRVENVNVDGMTLGSLGIRSMTNATISRVMHGNAAVTPAPETILHLGDLVKAVGSETALERIAVLIGKPTSDDIPLATGYEVQWVLVTNKEVVNKSLIRLNLLANYNATVTRIRRSGIDISPEPQSHLRFGDKLMIACDKENMKNVVKLLGNNDKRLSETDFLPISLGIVLGVLAGKINIPVLDQFSFNLGLTGGVLAVALILSRIGKTGPIIWSMSGSANQLLRQLGLLLFMASIGTQAGEHLVETVVKHGWQMFLIGAFITVIPMIVGTIMCQLVFKINFLTLLGVLTGGMTSTPGLAAIQPMTESNAPHIAYATVYPIALVCMILCSQILGRL